MEVLKATRTSFTLSGGLDDRTATSRQERREAARSNVREPVFSSSSCIAYKDRMESCIIHVAA